MFEGVTYRTADNWFPFIPVENDAPITYLEIGCFYGANIISVEKSYGAHPDSKLHCIDPWENYDDYPEYKEEGMQSNTYNTFMKNIENTGKRDKFIVHRGYSNKLVHTFPDEHFDIIYVDGNHEPHYVLEDGVLSFRKLKPGGYLIFDDFGWCGRDGPETGVEAFMMAYNKQIERVGLRQSQMILKKK
jgi:SAM-dependent methyltransferase